MTQSSWTPAMDLRSNFPSMGLLHQVEALKSASPEGQRANQQAYEEITVNSLATVQSPFELSFGGAGADATGAADTERREPLSPGQPRQLDKREAHSGKMGSPVSRKPAKCLKRKGIAL